MEMDDDFDVTLRELGMQDEDIFQKMDEDLDYALALMLQSLENESHRKSSTNDGKSIENGPTCKNVSTASTSKKLSVVHRDWELLDPNPDIQVLFLEFNIAYFWGVLECVEVRWSPRMTLCAGLCCYEGRGGLCSIRLSLPLLKLRPRRDLVETLLHEMIHAYLFVTQNNKDRDGHGPEFLKHMHRINEQSGAHITVYHSFHDEVDHMRQHWWKCNGPCQHKPPYFGIVKRAMNRAPAPRDPWWSSHQATCGGSYTKIKEPENYGQKQKQPKGPPNPSKLNPKSTDISNFFSKTPTSVKKPNTKIVADLKNQSVPSLSLPSIENVGSKLHTSSSAVNTLHSQGNPKVFVPFSGKGHSLSSTGTHDAIPASNGFKKKLSVPSKKSNSIKSPPTRLKNINAGKQSPKIFGGTLNRHAGSSTIVLNKTVQKANRKDKSPTTQREKAFTGTSYVLQQGSTPSDTKARPSAERQQSIGQFFPSQPMQKKQAIVFSSDSEDELESTKRNKTSLPPIIPSNQMGSSSDPSAARAPCPVCGVHVCLSQINTHLDDCLNHS